MKKAGKDEAEDRGREEKKKASAQQVKDRGGSGVVTGGRGRQGGWRGNKN